MSVLDNKKISFIGGGNMAQALISGLVGCGIKPDLITVADPSSDAREQLAAKGYDKVYFALVPNSRHAQPSADCPLADHDRHVRAAVDMAVALGRRAAHIMLQVPTSHARHYTLTRDGDLVAARYTQTYCLTRRLPIRHQPANWQRT